MLGRAAAASCAGVVVLCTLAGAAKAADLPVFVDSLEEWTVIPAEMRTPIGLLVPGAELALGAAWLGGRRRDLVELALALLLATFTVATRHQLQRGHAPACECFGVLEKYMRAKVSQEFGLYRSLLMCTVLAAGTLARNRLKNSQTNVPTTTHSAIQVAHRRTSAFTLLETMLVIVVVAVLLAMLAPSLSKVRVRAYATKDLASLRSCSAILAVYAGDWHDSFPSFANPKATQSVLYYNNGQSSLVLQTYFQCFTSWHYALADGYFGGNPRTESVFPSEQVARQGFVGGEPFLLTCTAFAEPDYWDLSKRTGRTQLGPTAHHQVAFPSAKIILYSSWASREFRRGDLAPANDDPRVYMPSARGDGSAKAIAWADIAPGVPSGDGFEPDNVFHFTARPPGAHTIGGLGGRDVR